MWVTQALGGARSPFRLSHLLSTRLCFLRRMGRALRAQGHINAFSQQELELNPAKLLEYRSKSPSARGL